MSDEYQRLYMGSGKRKPEEQFVDVLMERKKEQLERTNLGTLPKQDVIVKIYLAHLQDSTGQPRVQSDSPDNGMVRPSIKILSDCLLRQEMDPYTVLRSVLVQMLDLQSLWTFCRSPNFLRVGYDFLPDDKYMLAHVFGKEGDKIGYLYDFGDKWHHTLVIERILSVDDSDGSIKITDDQGMCLGSPFCGSSVNQLSPVWSKDVYDTMPLHPDAINTNIDQLKKGQSIVRDFSPDSHGYWQETTSTKDEKSETVCGLCGKPGGAELKTCSGCRAILSVVLPVRCLSEAYPQFIDIAHLHTKRNIGNQPIGNNAAGSTSKRSDPHATIRG
ncbi:hypothetical protein BDN71DRAFT_1511958 [Pleurotus eryngii]|uniref:Plasmid pRiA4b Orf3-like domain-containing protein n=1 Tax=Pleurotus eryngii TaxID=5323 RepID=A0A9P5ZKT0_PLEER|nr:hypothetical protein BDN71DRAFT_1511958 [Pleurotus eryngii]